MAKNENSKCKAGDPDAGPSEPRTWRSSPAIKVYQLRNRPELVVDGFFKTIESANGIPHECQYCKRTEKPIVFLPPQTLYKDDEGDFLCEECAEETRAHWAEMWAEYHSGLL